MRVLFFRRRKKFETLPRYLGPSRNEFLGRDEACIKFSLAKIYHDFWVKLVELYGPLRKRMLNQFALNLLHMIGLVCTKTLAMSCMSG